MLTPVILTYNEEANIQATIRALAWAPKIVVLDSGSTDRTEAIARSFRNVAWFARGFDNHRTQWEFAIRATGITTEFVLALDADMRPGTGFHREAETFISQPQFNGALLPFEFRVLGKQLFGSIYPPQVRLFRKDCVKIEQPGHTQVFNIDGPVYRFTSKLIHEDRKPIARWARNQLQYAELEAARIRSAPKPMLKDRLRTIGISPAIWGAYAYIKAGGPFNAPASRAYAYERLIFEALLARTLSEDLE